MSTINRPRKYCGGCYSKENRVQNGQHQHLQPHLVNQKRHLTPQQYEQLQILHQQHQHQRQRILLLQNHFQHEREKQILQQQQQQQQIFIQKQKQENLNLLFSKIRGSCYNGKGNEPLRGMTEYPTNDKQKSRQSQLNHTSPHHHSTHTKKRPLTTSPNIPYNYGIPNFLNQTTYANFDEKSFNCGLYDDELTEENLKKNVQIVLNNLDRYNNALRSIILNDQTNFNYNHNKNNNNNISINMANILSSPESDYNSNATHHPSFGHLNCSIASSHDFTHDNSDYQWFLDYGYRDGFTHQSVLSSLSASYNGFGELSYYEDLAKNIDANLAEVDMEHFCAEDIHSLLTHIPSFCKEKRSCRDEQNSEIDNSICKSELLFSPVKESHISIDSLDLESFPDDGDIILTCKANKDNYTIAFEGSTLYSDESFYAEPVDPNAAKNKQNCINLHSNLDDIVKRKSLEVSMSRSDHAFTTWSKLKKGSSSQLQRYPSGNNNTSVNIATRHAPHCVVRKSSSLPNLRLKKETDRQLNVSQAVSNSTVDSFKSRNLLPMCQMPISTSGSESPAHSSSNVHNTENSSSKQNQPAFNLVKLFIKQKSNSSDTCMDVSSGCWPSSDGSSSSEQQKARKKSMNDSGKGSVLSRHDEENGDVIDASYQLDSLDVCDQQNNDNDEDNNRKKFNNIINTTPKNLRNDLYREVFESSQTQIRNHFPQPLRNPQVYNLTVQNNINNNNNNNNNSMERDSLSRDFTNKSVSDVSRTSENLTQVFYSNNSSNNRMKIPTEMITKSMQTSAGLMRDRLRFIPPSFLAKLNNLGEEKRAPVYVIYPNYALPDLGFVKNNLSDVILSPFNYKNAISLKKRPTSLTGNDEEALKRIDYKHVADWKSLVTLLPVEYRKRLKHIPEADVELDPECSQKPLFCMTPPLRRNKTSLCDCATYFQQTCTSSSGSSQPPSSGYRGSSTLLTDSEMDSNIRNENNNDFMRNNIQYPPYQHQQYENNRLESEIIDRPPPSGGRTPRGILRKNLKAAARAKRNSMFEEENQRTKNVEKRRSLQDAYYMSEDHDIIEDYLAELEENKSKQYYSDFRNATVNAANTKLRNDMHFMATDINAIDKKIRKEQDLEARIRAENFLSSVPKSELKYYVEIANILESADNSVPEYDAAKLKNEVSRALSQKKVSFNNGHVHYLTSGGLPQKFSTPPNSPNISMAAFKVTNNTQQQQQHHQHRLNEKKELSSSEKEKQDKISSNRFKRLQIQWELLSKDSSLMLKDLARENETKSGGSTPTSANAAQRSRIPRPVSYPASKKNVKSKLSSDIRTTAQEQNAKTVRSPSRIVPPKKYSVPPLPNTITTTTATASAGAGGITAGATTTTNIARPRTPNRPNTTPKKRVPSPRSATRAR